MQAIYAIIDNTFGLLWFWSKGIVELLKMTLNVVKDTTDSDYQWTDWDSQ
jgi:hypothetical protein